MTSPLERELKIVIGADLMARRALANGNTTRYAQFVLVRRAAEARILGVPPEPEPDENPGVAVALSAFNTLRLNLRCGCAVQGVPV